MQADNYDKAKLVDYLFTHCNHKDQLIGLKTIAFVLRNRVEAGWGSWLQVLNGVGGYQGNPWVTNEPPSANDPLWVKLLACVDSIYDGSEPDLIATATAADSKRLPALFYVDLTEPITPWFRENILRKREAHHQVAISGRLTLFT